MRTSTFVLLVAASVLLIGCSSSVQIMSEPAGANVEINGKASGKTPLTLDLSNFAFNSYKVRLTKEGYKERMENLEKEVKPGQLIGGFFVPGLIFWCYGPMELQKYNLEKQ